MIPITFLTLSMDYFYLEEPISSGYPAHIGLIRSSVRPSVRKGFPPEPKTDTTAQLEKRFLQSTQSVSRFLQPTQSECIDRDILRDILATLRYGFVGTL